MTKTNRTIDLRSDTVTQPTEALRAYMAAAATGDDVYGEDPTINALEKRVAKLLDKESALLCTSGTQSNLIALLSHCQRGEEYIVGEEYHTYRYEAGGAAVLGGIVPQTVAVENDGSLDLATVAKKIKADDPHFPISRLLALENTHCGKVVPQLFINNARELCDEHGLQLHLDGARLFNAHIAMQQSLASLAQPFDSVSVCFSKGLGTPIGSVLVGSEALIKRGRRWRKMLGGGMRQAGIVAASLDYALDHHVQRLADDHANAESLAKGLVALNSSAIRLEPVQTNMVYVYFEQPERAQQVARFLGNAGIKVPTSAKMRLVTHMNVEAADIPYIVKKFSEALV
ncbi:low-specificity L-threonine aldolase [Aliidiomarina iranensis]|uniref:Low-specificity L-threonine aldolase n=1 Tax=Aliidiomarina iranensis TaxID=1434071 RepID=A0A432W0F5_9GAMM|nr:low-specificity L-threonine aldolase [Aliidiomarina iranensis]RUO22458.1 low-specificity L-threonine aldolase [Aliidiomarina iranensis]